MAWSGNNCKFITSMVRYSDANLADLPQIALVGRSNVGKSSIINTLVRSNKLAKISSTPGKTRLVNFFLMDDQFYLVDLPGYGYAKISKQEQAKWEGMIEGYLGASDKLKHVFLLLDIRRKPNDFDRQMAWWLQHYSIPTTIIATKADKLAKSRRKPAADTLSDQVLMTFKTPTIVFSTKTNDGRDQLTKRIEEILAQESTQ